MRLNLIQPCPDELKVKMDSPIANRRQAIRPLSLASLKNFRFPLFSAARRLAGLGSDNAISPFQDGDSRPVRYSLLSTKTGKAHNSEEITNFPEMGSRAIQLDDAVLGRGINYVRFEALTVLQIAHKYFFIRKQPNHLRDVRRNTKAAFVIETRACDRSPVDLGF